MDGLNYVATTHKPTIVTHSCVCNFIDLKITNLILAKCTHVEIHRIDGESLETILDVPIYARIATLETFRLHDEKKDCLLVATEEGKYFVLQWDPVNSKPVTRIMGDITKPYSGCHINTLIGIVDPECKLIILYSSDLLQVIHSQSNETFNSRLWVHKVVDIKFLFEDSIHSSIAVLYQDINGVHHIKGYTVSFSRKCLSGFYLYQTKLQLQYEAHLLIPVPLPFGGLVVIGCENIAYYNDNISINIPIELVHHRVSFTRAYRRVDTEGCKYLLGDHAGSLRLLVLIHEKEKVTGLKIEHLGETSIPSTISCLVDDIVFIGSRYGDSQVIKVNIKDDSERGQLKVLKRFDNLGPIRDFCIVHPERQGLGGCILTCSGAYKDSSLRIVYNALGINEQALVECKGIKGIWPLKSSTVDHFDKFLVLNFAKATRFFAMSDAGVLEETEIEGFCSLETSLFCHYAIHNQLVQILLATKSRELVYLEIGDGVLSEKKKIVLEYSISCLDIHSVSNNSDHSPLAAVGLWDRSVAIYSLPDLAQLTKVQLDLAPERLLQSEALALPRSLLLCAFEGIPYLLCGLGTGDLLYFLLNQRTGGLTDMKVVSPGAAPITALRTSSSNVLAVSVDWPLLINSSGKELVFSNINLRGLTDMCPFNTHAFPTSYAMARMDDLAIGTMDDKHKLHIHQSIPLGADVRCICHQVKTKTYAICIAESIPCAEELRFHLKDFESDYVRLIDSETFETRESFQLQNGEHGRCIVSYSFLNDGKEYYCVGTAYVFHHQNEAYKGRILIFSVGDGGNQFKLIAETEIKGAVYCLKGFQGKLLAAVGRNIQLYKWVPGDGACVLQMECSYSCQFLVLCMETINGTIIVGDLHRIILLRYDYEDGKGVIQKHSQNSTKSCSMSAIAILTDKMFLCATLDFKLLLVEPYTIEPLNEGIHPGGCVNRFQHGMVPWSEAEMTQCVTFGTNEGVIGVVAALSSEDYTCLRNIQGILSNMIGNSEWRGFSVEKEMSTSLLDGNLIESFIGLNYSQKEKISNAVKVSVRELCDKVEKLRRLH